VRVDHDFSLLVPELFSRMTPPSGRRAALIENGYLERMTDFELPDGEKVAGEPARLPDDREVRDEFFGRIFMHPDVVFTENDAAAGDCRT
jgi:hypothetical protein